MNSLKQHTHNIDAGPGIAFFDLDRTLIAGYSILALAQETVRLGAQRGELRQSAKLLRQVLRTRVDASGDNYHRLVRRLTKALTGVSESTLSELGQTCYDRQLARTLYREAITLVEAHRAAGHHLVIVSAASRYQIEPIARELGIASICCTRLEVEDGCFTGQVIAPMCYGEGKLLAARREARDHGIALKHCWFYTDSSADLPLLDKVGHPVAVNPSDRLAVHARSRGWPQLQFESRGLPRLGDLVRTGLTAHTLLATTALGMINRRAGVNDIRNANTLTRLLGDVGSAFAGLEYEVEGRENLQRSRPAVFVFNHQSLLDSLVLAHLLREEVVALCKREMADNPIVGPLLRQVDTIFVDRGESNQREVLQRALSVLSSGRSLVIAPEGTRSTLGKVQPFKHGAFYLAKKARVPIVPLVLHNVKDAMPKGGLLIRPASIRVTVLPPVYPEDMGSVRQVCSALEDEYIRLLRNSPLAALPHRARG